MSRRFRRFSQIVSASICEICGKQKNKKMEEILYSRIEGEGKPLLILHGYLGMSDNWKTLGGRFAQEGFEVHSLDLRNHGRSFHSDDFSYPTMIQDVLSYC